MRTQSEEQVSIFDAFKTATEASYIRWMQDTAGAGRLAVDLLPGNSAQVGSTLSPGLYRLQKGEYAAVSECNLCRVHDPSDRNLWLNAY